jgi:serine protease Do
MAVSLGGLRLPTGVVVTAQLESPPTRRGLLARGDVIHEVNGSPITTPTALREAIDRAPPQTAIVLQVERGRQLTYVVFDRTTQ